MAAEGSRAGVRSLLSIMMQASHVLLRSAQLRKRSANSVVVQHRRGSHVFSVRSAH